MTSQIGKLNGTIEMGACGVIPLVVVDFPKPKLTNNGYACYSGVPALKVDGLYDQLPILDGCKIRQGDILVRFSCGGQFLTWASAFNAQSEYRLS